MATYKIVSTIRGALLVALRTGGASPERALAGYNALKGLDVKELDPELGEMISKWRTQVAGAMPSSIFATPNLANTRKRLSPQQADKLLADLVDLYTFSVRSFEAASRVSAIQKSVKPKLPTAPSLRKRIASLNEGIERLANKSR